MNEAVVHFNNQPVGSKTPRIVGIVSSLSTIPLLLADPDPGCDVVEIRLDRIDTTTEEWEAALRQIEDAGYPVIATIRIPEEGGDWSHPEEERLALFERALDCSACIDIELRSALLPELAERAKDCNKALIISHHDYDRTPALDELKAVFERAAAFSNAVVKIAVRVHAAEDLELLTSFLKQFSGQSPLCLIGMGDLGQQTRLEFPRRGSCLAYGHIDGATAPGQLSCRELATALRPAGA